MQLKESRKGLDVTVSWWELYIPSIYTHYSTVH
jgi:hypothetical protein